MGRGRLFDATIGHGLPTLIQPETERVGIERPPAPPPDSPKPVMDLPPLGQLSWGEYFHADPRYRYYFEGNEYTAAEGAAMCEAHNSAEGWPWKSSGGDR